MSKNKKKSIHDKVLLARFSDALKYLTGLTLRDVSEYACVQTQEEDTLHELHLKAKIKEHLAKDTQIQ